MLLKLGLKHKPLISVVKSVKTPLIMERATLSSIVFPSKSDLFALSAIYS